MVTLTLGIETQTCTWDSGTLTLGKGVTNTVTRGERHTDCSLSEGDTDTRNKDRHVDRTAQQFTEGRE